MANRNFAQVWQCRHYLRPAAGDHVINLGTRNAEIAQHVIIKSLQAPLSSRMRNMVANSRG